MSVQVRPIQRQDVNAVGRLTFEAFQAVDAQHRFPSEFDRPESATVYVAMLLARPGTAGFVAEQEGQLIGALLLDERSPEVAGLGPLVVAPSAQARGVGRLMMERAMERVKERGFAGMRLMQASYQLRSLSLFVKLGFDVREPCLVLKGAPLARQTPGYTVRPAGPEDVAACNALCARVHGFERGVELAQALRARTAVVVLRDGRLTGYASAVGVGGHGVGETNEDLQALVASASRFVGDSLLVPTRNGALLRWLLSQGFEGIKPMNLMASGRYSEPAGAYLPSNPY